MRIRQDISNSLIGKKVYGVENNLDNGGNNGRSLPFQSGREKQTKQSVDIFAPDLENKAENYFMAGKNKKRPSLFNKILLACATLIGKREEVLNIQNSISAYYDKINQFESIIDKEKGLYKIPRHKNLKG